jgi:hypothetical protein
MKKKRKNLYLNKDIREPRLTRKSLFLSIKGGSSVLLVVP